MPNKSIFRAFITNLRKQWKNELPSIHPLTEARGNLPMASSFYAGLVRNSAMHVYLNFQHSNKSWEVGRFTINVVLTSDERNPGLGIRTGSALDLAEGSHRIGHLVGSKDKWWHLKETDDSILIDNWHPSSYENVDLVLSEAAEDVTQNVLTTLRLLDVPMEQS
jgi:hypothetical protein